jgi:hypothetical protein
MRKSVLGMSLLAVVLWAATGVSAQGQGKGQGGGNKERVKEHPANKAQENAPATAETADKNTGKGKTAKQADEQKQGGPQGKKGGKATTDAGEQGKGKGKGQAQQAQALQKQLQHEQAKHMERQARLARIRELAVKKGDTEMIARVDKLIAKEQEVYTRKGGKMQGQPRATSPAGPSSVAPTTVGPNAASEQKGKGKGGKEDVTEPKKAEVKQEETKK